MCQTLCPFPKFLWSIFLASFVTSIMFFLDSQRENRYCWVWDCCEAILQGLLHLLRLLLAWPTLPNFQNMLFCFFSFLLVFLPCMIWIFIVGLRIHHGSWCVFARGGVTCYYLCLFPSILLKLRLLWSYGYNFLFFFPDPLSQNVLFVSFFYLPRML